MFVTKTSFYVKAEGRLHVIAANTKSVVNDNLFFFPDTTRTVMVGFDKADIRNPDFFAKERTITLNEYTAKEIIAMIENFGSEEVIDKDELIKFLGTLQ